MLRGVLVGWLDDLWFMTKMTRMIHDGYAAAAAADDDDDDDDHICLFFFCNQMQLTPLLRLAIRICK